MYCSWEGKVVNFLAILKIALFELFTKILSYSKMFACNFNIISSNTETVMFRFD